MSGLGGRSWDWNWVWSLDERLRGPVCWSRVHEARICWTTTTDEASESDGLQNRLSEVSWRLQ